MNCASPWSVSPLEAMSISRYGSLVAALEAVSGGILFLYRISY